MIYIYIYLYVCMILYNRYSHIYTYIHIMCNAQYFSHAKNYSTCCTYVNIYVHEYIRTCIPHRLRCLNICDIYVEWCCCSVLEMANRFECISLQYVICKCQHIIEYWQLVFMYDKMIELCSISTLSTIYIHVLRFMIFVVSVVDT